MREYLGKYRIAIALLAVGLSIVLVVFLRKPGKACFTDLNEASCTTKAKFQTSSAHAPVRGLFIGYTPQIGMDLLLNELITMLHGDKIRIPLVVVYPQDESEASIQELNPFLRHPEIQLLKTTESKGIWTQDFMDIWYEGKSAASR